MRIVYDPGLKANLTLDDSRQVRAINHLDDYPEMAKLRGRAAAAAYVREVAGAMNIAPDTLRNLDQPVSYLDPQPREVEYHFSDEKPAFDTATYAYAQTFLNIPVWAAGV